MRYLVFIMALGMLLTGCASHNKAPRKEPVPAQSNAKKASTKSAKPAKPAKKQPPAKEATTALPPASNGSLTVTNQGLVMTLAPHLTGKVAKVNVPLRFVVVDFGMDLLPAVDQRLGVYRQGQKVGELKITGPAMQTNIVADLVTGEAAEGDEVRRD
jgi:hypothetical protein